MAHDLQLNSLEKPLIKLLSTELNQCLENLKYLMIEERNIGHDWQFSEQQIKLMNQYNDANNLLIDCLNSNGDISKKIRQKIEDNLLLSSADLQKKIK